MLDVPTLLFNLVLTDVLLAISLWVATSAATRHGIGKWVAALLLQALVFTLFALGGTSLERWSVAGVHVFGALSVALQLAAILEFYHRRLGLGWFAVPPLVFASLFGLEIQEPVTRIIAAGLLYGVALLTIAVVTWRCARANGENGERLGQRCVVLGFAAGGVLFCLRAVLAMLHPGLYIGAGTLLPVASALIAYAIVLAASFGFLLMHRERNEQAVQRLAMIDPLTGVYNRRTFFDLAGKEIARARRSKVSLSVVMLDVDHFKRINDRHGHQTGDGVLQQFAQVVRRCLREEDLLVRYGGEEFCILLADVARESAADLAERVRAAIENAIFIVGDMVIPVTASVGVATLGPDDDANLARVVSRADEAMYHAKNSGRNRVVVEAPLRAAAAAC